MAVDNDNNLPIAVDDGNQAIIGTDVFVTSGITAHSQVVKVAWGNESTVTRTTPTTPLPVQVYGLTGNLSRITVTGSVYGLGVFTVGNTAGSPLNVTGGIRSFVIGMTGATPVAVTGSVIIGSSVGITGTVNVTGGRILDWAMDKVEVTGSLGKSWNLSNLTDSIQVYGPAGSTHVFSRLVASNGTEIGVSGNALNVNVIGAGISANVTIGSSVQVENIPGSVLSIQGTGNGIPIPVSGTVSLSANTEVVLDDSSPINVIPPESLITYSASNQNANLLNSLEKILLAPETGTSKYHTISVWLRYLYEIMGGSSNTNTILYQLKSLGDGTSTVKTKSSTNTTSNPKVFLYDLTGNSGRYKVFSLFRAGAFGTDVLTANLSTNGYLYQNKSTENIYLTSTSHLANIVGSPCVAIGTGCPVGVASDTLDVTVASNITNINGLVDGCYILEPGTSALLPTLFDRAFITPTSTADVTAVLNVTIV